MSSYKPKMAIPNDWATNGACPICDRHSLYVEKTAGEPDRMSCTGCEASFEMESDGPHIRLVILPPEFACYIQPAWETWMTVHEIRSQISSPSAAISQAPAPQLPANRPGFSSFSESVQSNGSSLFDEDRYKEGLTQEDVNQRALGFSAVGNSAQEIRQTLTGLGATDEQINQALSLITNKEKSKPRNYPQTILLVFVVLLICLGAAALLLPMLNIPKYLSALRPFFSTFQQSFDSGQLSQPTTTPLPNQPVYSLPYDGQAYFDIITNLAGKFRDKATYLANSQPPVELVTINQEMVRRYQNIGNIEKDFEDGEAQYAQNCNKLTIAPRESCTKLITSNAEKKIELLAKQTELSDYWSTEVCKTFRDYYSKYNVIWPFGINTCPAP